MRFTYPQALWYVWEEQGLEERSIIYGDRRVSLEVPQAEYTMGQEDSMGQI